MEKRVLILLFLLLIYQANAAPMLHVEPADLNINVIKGTNKEFKLNIDTINSSDPIYNISFSNLPYFTFPKLNNMSTNSSREYFFEVYTDDVVDRDYTSTVSFDYYTQTTIDPATHYMTLDSAGFHPDTLTINKGDTLRIENTDTINHTFTRTDYSFDHRITTDQVFEKVFEDTGVINFFDRISDYGGSIEIKPSVIMFLTHSSSYDKTVLFHFDSNIEETQLGLSIFETNFSIRHNDSRESALQITNLGDETAYNIKLEMPWTTFDSNNFDLNASQSKVVLFNIIPSITSTNQSGIIHNLTMNIRGDNTAELTEDIHLYIPLTSFITFGNTTDLLAIWDAKLKFCREFPLSIECAMQPLIVQKNITKYVDKPTNISFTEDEVVQIKSLLTGEDLQQRIENVVKKSMSEMGVELTDINAKLDLLLNETRELRLIADDNAARLKRKEISSIIITFLLLFVIGITVLILGGVYGYKWLKKREAKKEGM